MKNEIPKKIQFYTWKDKKHVIPKNNLKIRLCREVFSKTYNLTINNNTRVGQRKSE